MTGRLNAPPQSKLDEIPGQIPHGTRARVIRQRAQLRSRQHERGMHEFGSQRISVERVPDWPIGRDGLKAVSLREILAWGHHDLAPVLGYDRIRTYLRDAGSFHRVVLAN